MGQGKEPRRLGPALVLSARARLPKIALYAPPKITGLFREFGIDKIAKAMYTEGMNEASRRQNKENAMKNNQTHTPGPWAEHAGRGRSAIAKSEGR